MHQGEADAIDEAVGRNRVRQPAAPDPVAHPPHYKSGDMEVIDVIEAFGLGFHLGNVVKYLLRAGRKGDALTDLKKGAWYLERHIKRLEGK